MKAPNFLAVALLMAGIGLLLDPALAAFDPSLEEDITSRAGRFLAILKEPRPEADFPARNLFEEWLEEKAAPSRFRLARIERTDPPVIYQGIMEGPEGGLTAQVNFQGISHFVREGSVIHGWKVLSLARTSMQITSPEGETLIFPYRMRVPGRVTFALIVKEPDGRPYRVSEGEQIEDYDVKEIGEALVRLQRDREIISLQLETGSDASVPEKLAHERRPTS